MQAFSQINEPPAAVPITPLEKKRRWDLELRHSIITISFSMAVLRKRTEMRDDRGVGVSGYWCVHGRERVVCGGGALQIHASFLAFYTQICGLVMSVKACNSPSCLQDLNACALEIPPCPGHLGSTGFATLSFGAELSGWRLFGPPTNQHG